MDVKKQISVRLNPEHLANLDKLAEHFNVTKGWLIQQAVARFINEEMQRLK